MTHLILCLNKSAEFRDLDFSLAADKTCACREKVRSGWRTALTDRNKFLWSCSNLVLLYHPAGATFFTPAEQRESLTRHGFDTRNSDLISPLLQKDSREHARISKFMICKKQVKNDLVNLEGNVFPACLKF